MKFEIIYKIIYEIIHETGVAVQSWLGVRVELMA